MCHTDCPRSHHASPCLRYAALHPHVRRLGIRWPTCSHSDSPHHAPIRLPSRHTGLRQQVPRSRRFPDAHSWWMGVVFGEHQRRMCPQMQEGCCRGVFRRSGRHYQAAVKQIIVQQSAIPRSQDAHQCQHWHRKPLPAFEYLCIAILRETYCRRANQHEKWGRIRTWRIVN